MRYEFVRFKTLASGEESNKWWFVADDISKVIEHTEKFFKPVMQNGFNLAAKDAIDAIFKYGDCAMMNHPKDMAAASIEAISDIKYERDPLAFFETANNLLLTAFNNRISNVKKGKSIYLEDGVREFAFNEKHYEIIETHYSDTLQYPDFKKPTLDDVRFIQWDGGEHWYAKVNKEDIVDKFGNQKWNTKDEAEKAAKWYIEKYY